MTKEPSNLETAEIAFEHAGESLRRASVTADLASRPGLSYARLDDALRGPYLVTWEGQLIGEVRSEEDTVLKGWYAVPISDEGAPSGPFLTIRAAAASLPR
ncbi:hypothetical protein ACPB9J_33815 [Streptomyces lavendulocolor]|uniref:hypothetical protein n=1 Tax=Streptomyces lavendulocolor TaxID=67316 RepID=UPI003C2EBEA8